MFAALRRIPEPLVLALGALLVSAFYYAGRYWFVDLYEIGMQMRTETASTTLLAGSWLAITVLLAVGYGWLRHRVAERARLGVRIAYYASLTGLASQLYFTGKLIVEFVIQTDPSSRFDWQGYQFQSLLFCAIAIALAMGLGFAVRRGVWLVVAIAAAVLSHPPWFVTQILYDHCSWRWILFVDSLVGIPWYVCQLVLLAKLTYEPAIESPRPTNGFIHARRALLALALAVGALAVIVVAVDTSSSLPPIEVRGAMLAATLLELAALVAFALAALAIRRANTGVSSWLLVVSATAALCVAGRLVYRAGEMAERYLKPYFDHPDHYGRSRTFGLLGSEPVFVSAVSAQLLIACAIGTFLVAIAIGAKRRGLEELRARTMVLVVMFAALSLVSLSGQKVIVTTTDLTPMAALILLGVAGTFVASVIVAVRAIRRGADGLAGSASLPVARLR